MLAIASRMEKPAGRRAACTAMWIAPAVGLILDLADLSHYGMRAVAVGILFLATVIGTTFTIGGISLVNAINESLRQHEQQRQETATALKAATAVAATTRGDEDEDEQADGADRAAGGGGGGGDLTLPGASDRPLLAARQKVVRMMVFAIQSVVMVMVLLLVAIFTGYGVAAPLPLYLVPSECSR